MLSRVCCAPPENIVLTWIITTESDADLDVIGDISDQAGQLANDRDFNFWYPNNREKVVEKLNARLFHQLLDKFRAKNWKHGIIYLGALSMQLGVKISDEEMLVLKETLPRTRMYDEAKEQMRVGLEGYKNDGEPWDFKNPGLQETASLGTAASEETKGKGEIYEDLGVFIHAYV